MEKSFIKTQVKGFAVVELIELEMELNEQDRKAFDQNPEAVMQRLLEESGQVVNRMMLTKNFITKHSTGNGGEMITRMMRADHNFHIVYPPNERSGWICA